VDAAKVSVLVTIDARSGAGETMLARGHAPHRALNVLAKTGPFQISPLWIFTSLDEVRAEGASPRGTAGETMHHPERAKRRSTSAIDQRVEHIRAELGELTRPFSPYTRSTVRRRFCGVFRGIMRMAEQTSPDVTIALLLDALSHHEPLADRRGFEEEDDRAIRASIDAALAAARQTR
jgi:hypothetical protein